MKLIVPMTIDNTALQSSSVPEDDYAEWNSSTIYAAEDRVIVIGTTHKVYESAQGSNQNNDPTTDDGTWWIEVSATNRWKAFDEKLADQTSLAGDIEYSILADVAVTGIALFNPEGSSVTVTVTSGSTQTFTQTVELIDPTEVTDWLEYFIVDRTTSFQQVVLFSLPAYAGDIIDITIEGTNSAVGEIVLGTVKNLGSTQWGTSVSILDFSTKEADTFGNFTIVERVFQDEVNFQFYVETQNVGKAKRVLASRRAKPTVYFSDFGHEIYGSVVYGYYEDFDIPLSGPSLSFATLEVRGLS